MSIHSDIDLRHLVHMTGEHGLFEHALNTEPRLENGLCTDDNARLLLVALREPDTGEAARLSRVALAFVLGSFDLDGRVHNRMDTTGAWIDETSTDDCWGRALWALGVAAAHHADPEVREQALAGFLHGARQRGRTPRTCAFAALGAVEVYTLDPTSRDARATLFQAMTTIGPIPSGQWCWPERRLAYANAALADALIAAGNAVKSAADVDRGLRMLAWLLALESERGHLSVAPVGGRGPDNRGPMFDQQPIEAATLADACVRAHALTGDAIWAQGVSLAAGWFTGHNDAGLVMFDAESGGGYDGLSATSVNTNQGAESTLAFVSTMQRVRALEPAS